ncbi:hypothetical protein [Ferrimonas balearica]|uniref:hypothetical protein n=1 Tax=Ferrimonas balearica TaxID=44012 RepID=UPI001C997DF9|nr:hypothetical protein [Ferrimonas balearica]MBY5992222.1 hypothetical protein [Ferrimonas balearica]
MINLLQAATSFSHVQLIMLVSSSLWAQPFDAFPEWDNESRYKRGTVVQHLSHLWVARLPNAGRPPHEYPLWARAKLVDLPEWHEHRWYPVGVTVIHKGIPYLARQANRSRPNHADGSNRWIPFDHPALGYDLPVTDEAQAQATLLGVDSNDNGVRDDYEVRVVMRFAGRTREVALGVADSFHKVLLADAATASQWPQSESYILMGSLIDLMDCQVELRQEEPEFSGLFHIYFNTPERIRVDRQNQEVLGERIGWDTQFPVSDSPCESAMQAVQQ